MCSTCKYSRKMVRPQTDMRILGENLLIDEWNDDISFGQPKEQQNLMEEDQLNLQNLFLIISTIIINSHRINVRKTSKRKDFSAQQDGASYTEYVQLNIVESWDVRAKKNQHKSSSAIKTPMFKTKRLFITPKHSIPFLYKHSEKMETNQHYSHDK